MFTGIIESLQRILKVQELTDGRELTVTSPFGDEVRIGESIAINGACLTVVQTEGGLRFQAGFETLNKTNLGDLRAGDRVNLERSLKLSDRLGGHLVTGHVDGIGHIRERAPHGEFELTWFSAPLELLTQMAPKGSVAVDGISLTLMDVRVDRFSVMLIPHTLSATTLGIKQPGATVNLETDLLAKYVQKQLSLPRPS
jgi:riboflavin synthase